MRLPVCYFHWRFKCMGCQRHKKCVQVVPEGRLDICMYYIYIYIYIYIYSHMHSHRFQFVLQHYAVCFENWLCMQSHICGSLRLFAHFLCERGKLGANSTLVPSWGREGPRKNRGKESKPAARTSWHRVYLLTAVLCHYVFIMTLGHEILVEMAGRQGSALMIYIVISGKNCTPMPI